MVGLKTASDGNRTDGDGWGNSGTENGGSNTPFCPTPSLFLYDREDLFLYDRTFTLRNSRGMHVAPGSGSAAHSGACNLVAMLSDALFISSPPTNVGDLLFPSQNLAGRASKRPGPCLIARNDEEEDFSKQYPVAALYRLLDAKGLDGNRRGTDSRDGGARRAPERLTRADFPMRAREAILERCAAGASARNQIQDRLRVDRSPRPEWREQGGFQRKVKKLPAPARSYRTLPPYDSSDWDGCSPGGRPLWLHGV